MSSAIKKVNMITQIVRLRQVVQRWKTKSFTRRRTPSGTLAVYVGTERRRFVIPTRFLNLPVFFDLLNQAEEEFGFPAAGGLVLPCETGFFSEILRFLEADEEKYGGLRAEEFWNLVSDVDFDRFKCKGSSSSASSHVFTPLLAKTRV